ncbi:MAG: COG4280 domain-containing protein [Gaiellaceae bacterium]
MSSNILLFLTTFVASAVEAVEALTIVLAVGVVRGWRSTLIGVGAASIVLAAIVAVLGPALRLIPIGTLRFVVGALLLAFGLQWLRKAILRASGYKPLHDEGAAFTRERKEAGTASPAAPKRLDWYSFTVAFKGVLLEGLEVTFIVITFGSTQGRLGLAAAAGAAAVVVVVAVGLVVRGPLERVPENTLKFVVGVLLTSFGIFWGGEGAGVEWPGGDVAILGLIAFLGLLSIALTRRLRRRRTALRPATARA